MVVFLLILSEMETIQVVRVIVVVFFACASHPLPQARCTGRHDADDALSGDMSVRCRVSAFCVKVNIGMSGQPRVGFRVSSRKTDSV